ncbi:MHS family MFS transporter [Arthrobacter sp. I2-34]|uniref:MHS family MFS transporter n=1 Tax=Arthrobacter hankyongi TaxID=2904801 RepID=A0ABS9L447_9MICC|nr:MFS transporter [Arthrobacter hankyongi]MCG2621422.1 MHS family MFS transporter [Arthrobacter hankyongi]
MRRVLGSSLMGSIIEYYDFILYATAASLIFDKVFFSNLSPAVALFASFGTLAVGYVARPLGGIIFGHFGDRIGRKKMLVLSMLMMGGATVAIGLLPTTAAIGIAAPVILVTLRFIQGISVGGEWGGATLMALEHAPANKRGFAAAFANAGGPAGGLLATFVVSGVSAATGDQFLVWGWRIPFILSAVLILIGMLIRLKVAESPVFKALEAKAAERQKGRKAPLGQVLRRFPRVVIVTLVASLGFYTMQGILTTWGVSVAVAEGVDRSAVLNIKGVAAVFTVVVCFAAARMSDRFGRRAVLTVGGIAGILWAFPALQLMHNGTAWGFALAVIVGNGVIQGILAGPIGAYISEQFPAEVRYTGASLAYQGSSTLGAGFTPMIATALVAAGSGGYALVGAFWIAVLAVGLVAVRMSREGAELKQKQHA